MSMRITRCLGAILALVVLAPQAWAQRPPLQDPVDIGETVTLEWDRLAMPGDIPLLGSRTVLAHEAGATLDYGKVFMTCESSTDSRFGRCPTADTGEASNGRPSVIALRFTEQRSGLEVDIDVHGSLYRIDATPACSSDYWSVTPGALWSSHASLCVFQQPAGTGAQLWVPASELGKLVAGKWRATLRLTLRRPADQPLANHAFTFDLTVTDRDAVAIYFPEFDKVSPLVQLNADYDPLRQTIGGRTTLDMCLYDGLGSQAPFLGVTVQDMAAHPPGPTGYALWHGDGGTDRSRRLDYHVSLTHNGATVPLPSGAEQQLHGIDTARLRLVMLPGMNLPVYCVPTPLTFDIPRVPVAGQRPGIYFGELRVQLRVPTVSP